METSDEIIEMITDLIPTGTRVLEPSAGDGKLVKSLRGKGCEVEFVELNRDNYLNTAFSQAASKGWNMDFLKFRANPEYYDYVAAVPPYKDNVDCQHIMHMYDCVKTGGKVISLTLPTWVTGIYTNQIAFRKWLDDKDYKVKFIEDKSYVLCPKMLLIIRK